MQKFVTTPTPQPHFEPDPGVISAAELQRVSCPGVFHDSQLIKSTLPSGTQGPVPEAHGWLGSQTAPPTWQVPATSTHLTVTPPPVQGGVLLPVQSAFETQRPPAPPQVPAPIGAPTSGLCAELTSPQTSPSMFTKGGSGVVGTRSLEHVPLRPLSPFGSPSVAIQMPR